MDQADTPIKVLVVDDSAVARGVIAKLLRSHSGISVIGFCQNGTEIASAIERLRPEVITLDVEMPLLKGTTILKHILSKYSIPVIMVSSMTRDGAQITLDCLTLGALDFVLKPGLQSGAQSLEDYAQQLTSKVLTAGLAIRSKTSGRARTEFMAESAFASTRGEKKQNTSRDRSSLSQTVIAIGASTGGPSAVASLLKDLPPYAPPILVAIHMPATFTTLYADRLSRTVPKLRVKLAESGELLCPGTAYIAPGDHHLQVVRKDAQRVYAKLVKPSSDDLYKPSIDLLFSSIALAYGGAALACVLTGMGNDGALGAADIFKQGGYVMSQDEQSCAIYGMPKVVFENGHSHGQVSLHDFSQEIVQTLHQRFVS